MGISMTEVLEQTDRTHFEAALEEVKALDAPSWLREIREAGAACFAQMEYPHYKQEAWRFTNIAPIVNTPFRSIIGAHAITVRPEDVEPYLYDEPDWPQLVFVDGIFVEGLSKVRDLGADVTVGPLAHAIAANDEALQQHLGKAARPTHVFSALNAGLLQDGTFLHVRKGAAPDVPIHCIYLSTGSDGVASHPRNLLVVDESAEISVIETYAGLNDDAAYLTNAATEIIVGDNATLRYHNIVLEGAASYHLDSTNVVQGRDSNLVSFTMSLSGKIMRNELDVVLDGEGGNTNLSGLYLNDSDRLIDNALHVTHAKSKCYSRMSYKGVLDGTSSSVFTGKVLVLKDSQRTDSDQLNNNLLLSDKATIDTKPQLEIFADDVKCTHGATIGAFPPELIFYFQSRGMTPAMAHAVLTYGFAMEIVDGIGIAPLRERLARYVFNKYDPSRGDTR